VSGASPDASPSLPAKLSMIGDLEDIAFMLRIFDSQSGRAQARRTVTASRPAVAVRRGFIGRQWLRWRRSLAHPLKCAARRSLAQTNSELGPSAPEEVEKEAAQMAASSH
jgi:hypothetical protein